MQTKIQVLEKLYKIEKFCYLWQKKNRLKNKELSND